MAAEAGAAGAQILLAAVDLGVYDDGVDGIVHPGGLIALTAAEVRYTTGAYDRELVLPDGDRPGVMLAGGGRRLLIRERTMPGTRALIVVARQADIREEPRPAPARPGAATDC